MSHVLSSWVGTYVRLAPLSVIRGIERRLPGIHTAEGLLLYALELIFYPRTFALISRPWRPPPLLITYGGRSKSGLLISCRRRHTPTRVRPKRTPSYKTTNYSLGLCLLDSYTRTSIITIATTTSSKILACYEEETWEITMLFKFLSVLIPLSFFRPFTVYSYSLSSPHLIPLDSIHQSCSATCLPVPFCSVSSLFCCITSHLCSMHKV